MSIYAQFDEDGECIQVASNSGWSEFGDWVESISGYTRIAKLWDSGECDDIKGIRGELEAALTDDKPENKDVEDIGHQIIHAIDAAGKADFFLCTNGIPVSGKSDDKVNSPSPKSKGKLAKQPK